MQILQEQMSARTSCTYALSYCTTTRNAYHGLFKAHVDEEVLDDIRVSTNGNYVLGNERFKDEISGILKRRVVPGKAGRPTKLD